jgi:hypothetical protein
MKRTSFLDSDENRFNKGWLKFCDKVAPKKCKNNKFWCVVWPRCHGPANNLSTDIYPCEQIIRDYLKDQHAFYQVRLSQRKRKQASSKTPDQ